MRPEHMRRFQVGDLVRLTAERLRSSYDIAPDEVGTVVGVIARTGPTYQIAVQFPHASVPYDFESWYELVQAVPDNAA